MTTLPFSCTDLLAQREREVFDQAAEIARLRHQLAEARAAADPTRPPDLDAVFQRLFSRGVREVRISPGPPVILRLVRESGLRHFFAVTPATALLLADEAIRRSVVVEEQAQRGPIRAEEELP